MPQRQRARLLLHQRHEREPPRLAVRQQRPGRDDRRRPTSAAAPAGRRPLPAAGRAGRPTSPAAGRTRRRSSGPATSSPAGPAAGPCRAATRGGRWPTDLGLILPPVVLEALERGLPRLDRRFRGLFLKDATLTGPESRGSSPVRIPRDPADPRVPGASPASTPAARGPATPAGSSAPPSTASGRRGPSSPATPLPIDGGSGGEPLAIGGAFRLGRIAGRSRRAMARHPRISAAVAVPVGAFLVLVPDLFGAIPWSVKKPVGWLAFLALLTAGLVRLLTVKPGDRWPAAGREEAVPDRWGRAAPWALAAAVGSLAIPLLQRPEALGFGDYDHHLQKFEVIRRTILDHHQFPWWSPWCRGGFPLASEPECGVASVATPLVLAFGPRVGLRLANVLCLMIAAEGARRLARWWIVDPWAAAVAGLVYSLHGGMAVYVAAGHYIPMSYCATPWLIYCVNRLADGPRYGVGLGLWAAFDVLNGISYPSVYALMIAAVVWLRGVRVERGRRRQFLEQSAVAVGIGLLLTGWRLGTMASVLRDYPREMWPTVDLEPLAPLFLMLDRPRAEFVATMTNPLFWESNCYIGFVGVGLFALSLRGGVRWWHVLAVVVFLDGAGRGAVVRAELLAGALADFLHDARGDPLADSGDARRRARDRPGDRGRSGRRPPRGPAPGGRRGGGAGRRPADAGPFAGADRPRPRPGRGPLPGPGGRADRQRPVGPELPGDPPRLRGDPRPRAAPRLRSRRPDGAPLAEAPGVRGRVVDGAGARSSRCSGARTGWSSGWDLTRRSTSTRTPAPGGSSTEFAAMSGSAAPSGPYPSRRGPTPTAGSNCGSPRRG